VKKIWGWVKFQPASFQPKFEKIQPKIRPEKNWARF